jgi:hypothetical protein
MPTFPGFHPDFELNAYPREIQSAIRKIAQNFYITRNIRPIQVGNSQYYAILVRPTDEFAIYINTDREVIILFAQYGTFEIRTLEAYELIYEILESKRVDRSLRFLVSSDNRIEDIMRHYLDQHPEYPIIIPITFHQILQTRNSLLDAVRRNYLLRDLFGYQNPLREETFFFGRQHIVNAVLDMAKSGQNSSLFGLRKSGKTSAIYAIQRKAAAHSCNVVVIDCQNPSVHARRYNGLLGYIVTEARRITGQRKLQLDIQGDPAQVSEEFFLHMSALINNLKGTLLLIFDEIENISPGTSASPHWTGSQDTIYFWQIIRSFIQSASKGRLSICMVGTNPHVLELAKINDIANPIYLYAQKRFIPNLTFDETREMVERLGYFMGLEFPVETINALHGEFGGHPFFTRQVCSKIHLLASATRPVKVSKHALQNAMSEFSWQLEKYIFEILEHLRGNYPDEYGLLSDLVNGKKSEINEFGSEAPELIDHLIGYGLIEKVGADFDIRFEAIKHALLKIVGTQDVESRWAEVSNRRNLIESHLRVALFHWSKGIAPRIWRETVEKNFTKKRFLALTTLEPRVLFSSKESPLYFSDLIMLIRDKDVLPYIEGDRSAILSAMDTVNKLRRDAHALQIDDDELKSAREAFLILESEFVAP